jgi:hypothetical protein
MSHLLERYSFADFRRGFNKRTNSAALALGKTARWFDALCSDFVLIRTTQFTWGQARIARALGVNLTIVRSSAEIRTLLLGCLRSVPHKNSWSLNERVAKHFPPHPDRSDEG